MNNADASTSKIPFDAKIKRILSSGLIMECPENREGWLPADEWDWDFDEREWIEKQGNLIIGEKVDVVKWGKSIKETQIALSRRRAIKDPWADVTNSLIGKIKVFQVAKLTKYLAIGDIVPGIQAKIRLDSFDKYFEGKSDIEEWQAHRWISVGDFIGGIVSDINYPDNFDEPCLILDPYKLFEQIENDPGILTTDSKLIDYHDHGPKHKNITTYSSNPIIGRIFLLDNDVSFVDAVKETLVDAGYDVTTATSEKEALEKLDSIKQGEIHLALLDLHLLENHISHDGIKIAKQIAESDPYCKIIFVSAEDVGPENKHKILSKIKDCGDLLVSGYIEKPVTVAQLHMEIASAVNNKPCQLDEILFSGAKCQPHSYSPEINTKYRTHIPKGYTTRWSVQKAVNELGNQLFGVVVHVFEMDPRNMQGRSYANFGEHLYWHEIRYKLDKSPVRDTAIDLSRKPWVDHDVESSPSLKGKHFWLRKKMKYRSALGFPIWASSQRQYCLLAFHCDPNKFDSEFVAKARLCAEKVGRSIEWKVLTTQSEERSRYETAGMAFVCLAHELRNDLMSLSIKIHHLEKWIKERYDSGNLLKEAANKRDELQSDIDRAIMISRTFRGVQSRGESEDLNVFECLEDAIRASIVQIPTDKSIEIRHTQFNNNIAVVRGDRSGLVISIFNLIQNAIQQICLFVRETGLIWVNWKIIEKYDGDWIQIDINDSGPGIHTSDYERVFDAGYSTKQDGIGMGLHICRSIITEVCNDKRKGSVEITNSILGLMTTFSIRLPIIDFHSSIT